MASGSCAGGSRREDGQGCRLPRTHLVLVDEGRALGTECVTVLWLRNKDWRAGRALMGGGESAARWRGARRTLIAELDDRRVILRLEEVTEGGEQVAGRHGYALLRGRVSAGGLVEVRLLTSTLRSAAMASGRAQEAVQRELQTLDEPVIDTIVRERRRGARPIRKGGVVR